MLWVKGRQRTLTCMAGLVVGRKVEDLYRAPVAQLVGHRVVTREVVSSTPTGPKTRRLKITEEKVLPL